MPVSPRVREPDPAAQFARQHLRRQPTCCVGCGRKLQEDRPGKENYAYVFRGRLMCIDCICRKEQGAAN